MMDYLLAHFLAIILIQHTEAISNGVIGKNVGVDRKYCAKRFLEFDDNKSVFRGVTVNPGTKEEVAMKFENSDDHNGKRKTLEAEYKIYRRLGAADNDAVWGILNVLYFGSFDKYFVLVTLPYGDSLYKRLNASYNRIKFGVRKFTKQTIYKIAVQLIELLERIHEKGVLYLGMQLCSIVIGLSEETKHQIFFINFGKSIFYKDDLGQDIDGLQATDILPCYASRAILLGFQPNRIDDLTAAAYIILKLMGIKFSWEKYGNNRQKVASLKEATSIEKLCTKLNNEMKSIIKSYFNIIQNTFNRSRPTYNELKALFYNKLKANHKLSNVLDWFPPKRNVWFCK